MGYTCNLHFPFKFKQEPFSEPYKEKTTENIVGINMFINP